MLNREYRKMKVLIVGANSYIGNHIDEWLTAKGMEVDQLDVLTEKWKTFDYSPYDALVHVAGIVHRPNCKDADLYNRVNSELPVAIAELYSKAKSSPSSCVNQKSFIFFSSMAVFGVDKRLAKNVITTNTRENPRGLYGTSKRNAEIGLLALQEKNALSSNVNKDLHIVIVRPPNVYGKGCKGGYVAGFLSVVKKLPVIPKAYTDVKQSMLYIDNLSEFIHLAILKRISGIFMPQDDRAVSATEITSTMAKAIEKKQYASIILGYVVRLFSFLPIIKKAYGGIEYDSAISTIPGIDYVVVPFEEGMRRTIQ